MVKFSLYENAIDSINHGIEHLEKASVGDIKQDYKQAILLMFQGVELLQKSLLGQINPILIFDKNSIYEKCKDPLHPSNIELEGCKSLEIIKLCSEVCKYYPKEFSKDSFKIIQKLAKFRNRIQHFGISIDKNEIVMLLVELYFKVISPSLKLFGSIISTDFNIALQESAKDIFSFFENAENEEKMLNIIGKDFSRGNCTICNNYSLFMLYKDGYPEHIHCSSCEFELKNIDISNYRICPECGANSLLYIKEQNYGLCTWYKCCTHKDGGIPVEMDYCENCNDYSIEGICNCNRELEI